MLSALTEDTDLAENVKATQYVAPQPLTQTSVEVLFERRHLFCLFAQPNITSVRLFVCFRSPNSKSPATPSRKDFEIATPTIGELSSYHQAHSVYCLQSILYTVTITTITLFYQLTTTIQQIKPKLSPRHITKT